MWLGEVWASWFEDVGGKDLVGIAVTSAGAFGNSTDRVVDAYHSAGRA